MEQNLSFVENGFRRVLIIITCILCLWLYAYNLQGIRTANNDIAGNFTLSTYQSNLIKEIYNLVTLIAFPFCSWISAKLGRRNALMTGAFLFSIFSFACGNAHEFYTLCLFRLLQSFCAGLILVLSHTVLTESWKPEKRVVPQAIAVLTMLTAFYSAAPLGGWITDNYSWAYVFFLNIPVGIIVGGLTWGVVRNGKYDCHQDWRGTILLTAGIICLYITVGEIVSFYLYRSAFLLAGSILIICFFRQNTRINLVISNNAWNNSNLRLAVLITFLSSLLLPVLVISMAYSPQHPTGEFPVGPGLLLTLIIFSTGAIMFEDKSVLKYLTIVCFVTMIASCCTSYLATDIDVEWLYFMVINAVFLLELAGAVLSVSKQAGIQIGESIAYYYVALALGPAWGNQITTYLSVAHELHRTLHNG